MKNWRLVCLLVGLLAGCAAQPAKTTKSELPAPGGSPLADPYPSTYRAAASAPTLVRNATVLTGTGQRLDDSDVLFIDGRIGAVGRGLAAPADAQIIDGRGRWVTPGIIDVHSHLGVYASPGVAASSDGNEATAPVTAEVWAEHSVWPQDPGFNTARIGGVTTVLVTSLPSAAVMPDGFGSTPTIVRRARFLSKLSTAASSSSSLPARPLIVHSPPPFFRSSIVSPGLVRPVLRSSE